MKIFANGLLGLFFTSSLALGALGGADSGGGDNKSIESGSAWFLGDRAIRYCTEIAPAFGVSAADIDRTIENVFQTWKTYLVGHHILQPTQITNIYISLNRKPLATCDGSEDLKFYFGVMNEEIGKAKAAFENPSAFAHRTNYDISAGWGKGFVWIAPQGTVYPKLNFPDWTLPARLNGILLHEMGHVLGCEHYDGTIMRESINELLWPYSPLFTTPSRVRAMLTHVDDTRELVQCWDCAADYAGTISLAKDRASEFETFQRLTGHSATGLIKARLHLGANFVASSLTLTDESGSTELSFTNNEGQGSWFLGDASLFRAVKVNSEGNPVGGRMFPGATLLFGWIRGADGKNYLATLEKGADRFGLSGGPALMTYFLNGKRLPLFATQLPGTKAAR